MIKLTGKLVVAMTKYFPYLVTKYWKFLIKVKMKRNLMHSRYYEKLNKIWWILMESSTHRIRS